MNTTENERLRTLTVGDIPPLFAIHELDHLSQLCLVMGVGSAGYGVTSGSTFDVQK